MNSPLHSSIAACIACVTTLAVPPMVARARAATLRIVPTYENASVYVEGAGPSDAGPRELTIRYREKDSVIWQEGHALSVSADDASPRGSLFGLKENTAYEVRCETGAGAGAAAGAGGGGRLVAEAVFRTWADNVPVARTVNLRSHLSNTNNNNVVVGGTPDGWVRYVAAPGSVIDGGNDNEEAILLENISRVILDGLTVRGGRRHGIRLKNCRQIRIRNCDIAGFGRVGVLDPARRGGYYMPGDTKPVNQDAGVYVDQSGDITIERTWIHDPRNHANSWTHGHPAGPNAIFVRSTGGMVIRHNDLVGSETRRWNDVIEGYGNRNVDGGFNRDSDIYGNYLAFPNDDGIELDGGQCNVRLYGNKIEGGLCGISTAPNRRGPSYVFNNLVVNLGDERGATGAAVKNGGGSTWSRGTTYFYHNTFLTFGHGIAATGYGRDSNRGLFFAHTRNNVFATSGDGIHTSPSSYPAGRYAHDVFVSPDDGADAGQISGAGAGVDMDVGVRVPGLATFQPAKGAVRAGVWTEPSQRMPDRPAPATLDHGQLILSAAHPENTPVTRDITLVSRVRQPVAFRILKNATAAWLDVTPASGLLSPGPANARSLRVRFDPAGRAGQGLLAGAFIVKFDNGDSIPLTVYATAAPAPLRLLFEAEQLDGHTAFEKISDPGASGGAAVRLVDRAAGKSGKGQKTLQATFDLPAAGACFVALRIRCAKPYGEHDSLFVSINDAPPRMRAVTGADRWGWARLTGQTMHLDLPAGANRITFIPREELDLDAVLVSERPLMAGERVDSFLNEIPPPPLPPPPLLLNEKPDTQTTNPEP